MACTFAACTFATVLIHTLLLLLPAASAAGELRASPLAQRSHKSRAEQRAEQQACKYNVLTALVGSTHETRVAGRSGVERSGGWGRGGCCWVEGGEGSFGWCVQDKNRTERRMLEIPLALAWLNEGQQWWWWWW